MTAEWGTDGHREGFEDSTIRKLIREDGSRWVGA